MMKTPEDFEQETFFYNGWLKMVNICCVFLFTPTGKIALAAINSPGSMHDFTVSRTIFSALINPNVNPLHYVVVGDSAFSSAATDTVIATAENFVPPPQDLPRDSSGAVNAAAASRLRESFRAWHRRVVRFYLPPLPLSPLS